MKRFSIFCAALFAAVTSFAAVNYELNGGVTNDEGWMSKSDMWETFKVDAGITSLGTLAELKADADPYTKICTPLGGDQAKAILDNARWDWLEAYVMEVQNADLTTPATQLTAGTTSAGWRYALAAFFLESQRTGWPKSADFSQAGKYEAFQPSWKHAYANPTEPTGEWVLNAPYKEGETFFGWYWNADFSGEKVTTINAESTGTLYAKFGQYIPTVAEVKAMPQDSVTQVSGVVTFIQGKNVYIQDATGGLLLYMAATPTFAVSQNVVVKGKTTTYGGAPELTGVTEVSAEAGVMPDPIKFESLTPLVTDSELKYFGQLVTVPGVVITEYDDHNNPTFSDGINTALGYKMVLDPVAYPVGTKVILTAIAAYYNGFQFVGDVAGVEIAIAGKKENYEYIDRSNGRYTLENDWVISVVEDNFSANKPGGTDIARGMVVKEGIMYFINREQKAFVRVNAKTGEMLDPLPITGDHLFQVQGEDGQWSDDATLAYNDVKFDQAGNCLIGGCLTGGNTFQIYKVDLETGAATLVVKERLYDNPDFTDNGYRFDAFGAAGDVTANGVIMAADANSWNVYRWLIEDGVVAPAEQIKITFAEEDETLIAEKAQAEGPGTAPQIFPQDETGSLFYIDGFNTVPTLFDETGALIDDFANLEKFGTTITNQPGEALSVHTGLNGLCEFQVGDEYFLVMVAGHTVSSAPSAFALYRFADDYRSFEEMEPLWFFPHNGLGGLTNGCRTAVPSVEVKDNTVKLYIYSNNNGYAAYTFTVDPSIEYVPMTPPTTDIEDVEMVEIGAKKVIENAQIYILKNGVKFNILGSKVK